MLQSLRHTLTARRAATMAEDGRHASVTLRNLSDAYGAHMDATGGDGPRLDASAFSDYENGKRNPRDIDAIVTAYADALGVTPVELWTEALALYAKDAGGVRAATARDLQRATSRPKARTPRRASA